MVKERWERRAEDVWDLLLNDADNELNNLMDLDLPDNIQWEFKKGGAEEMGGIGPLLQWDLEERLEDGKW